MSAENDELCHVTSPSREEEGAKALFRGTAVNRNWSD